MADAQTIETFDTLNTGLADIPSGLAQARGAAGGLTVGGQTTPHISPNAGAAIGGLTFVGGVNSAAIGAAKFRQGLATNDTGKLVEGGAQGTQGVANVVQGGAGIAEQSLKVASETAPALKGAAETAAKVGRIGGGIAGVTDIVSGGYKLATGKDGLEKFGGAVDATKGALNVAGAIAGGSAAPILGSAAVGLQAGKFIAEKSTAAADEISKEQGYFGKDPLSKTGENLDATGDAVNKNLATREATAEKLGGLRIAGYGLNDTAVDVLSTGAGLAHGTAAQLTNNAYTLGRRGYEKLRALF